MVRKHNDLVKQMFDVFVKMIMTIDADDQSTVEWLNEREDDDDVEITAYEVGQECLYRVSMDLGGKIMSPIAFGTAAAMINVSHGMF